ncbi:MAG: sulfite exporter TauE/SafE family protein [Pseudomonadota bacterium]
MIRHKIWFQRSKIPDAPCQAEARLPDGRMLEFLGEYGVLIAALIGAGLLAGLMAGLFGIGGGAVIVPALIILFETLDYGTSASHVAIGTSLATIILTSTRSVMAHHAKGAVDWDILRAWAPWIMFGAIIGQVLTGFLSARALKGFFGVMAFLLAAQLFFGRPGRQLGSALPTGGLRAILATLIGKLSALMGIGGGTFGVSLLIVYGHPIHRAVATAAGFGVAIGLPSALTAIFIGWGRTDLPPFSAGHVNLPAFVLISALTVIMAPIGARLAHILDAALLKKLFAVLLALVACRMLISVIAG